MENLEKKVTELWNLGYGPLVIADTLKVPKVLVVTIASLLGLSRVSRLSTEDALKKMGLSESYIAYVRQDERSYDYPVFDKGDIAKRINSEERG
jgi:hypothetical protein